MAINVFAVLVAKDGGSNRPTKYTSWPCLAPSIGSVAAVVVAVYQQQYHHSISAAYLQHSQGIPIALSSGHFHPTTIQCR